MGFFSAYLEQVVFKEDLDNCGTYKYTGNEVKGVSNNAKCCETDVSEEEGNVAKDRSVLAKFFDISATSVYRDLIRLVLTFVSVMLSYALMLAAMSFVLVYFFAIILGYSFGEIFFLRLSKVVNIDPKKSICSDLH